MSPTRALDAGWVVNKPAQRSSMPTMMTWSEPLSIKRMPIVEVESPNAMTFLLPSLPERDPAIGEAMPPIYTKNISPSAVVERENGGALRWKVMYVKIPIKVKKSRKPRMHAPTIRRFLMCPRRPAYDSRKLMLLLNLLEGGKYLCIDHAPARFMRLKQKKVTRHEKSPAMTPLDTLPKNPAVIIEPI